MGRAEIDGVRATAEAKQYKFLHWKNPKSLAHLSPGFWLLIENGSREDLEVDSRL
ncbi:MAG: hypothetical protein HQ567_11985 [Candidatus Nealsonbacteria bacterium]|nr:hypothetical protein [Candidatus Nealsonbacteria bacterium]